MNKESFIDIVKPYSMTSPERISELFDSLEEIRLNNIQGDLIECGVWKGGNILGIMEYLDFHKMDRDIWLYDTFTGMTEPSQYDVDINNYKALDIWQYEVVKCFSPLEEVTQILSKSNYPFERLNIVVGDICITLKNKRNIPEKIALLRLDTDWYESTKIELEVLYPNLVEGGILIIDDYGHWSGAKKATDEFFSNKEINFKQIDYTGIKLIK